MTTAPSCIQMNGHTPRWISRVCTTAGATLRKKNSDHPTGGVKNDVCIMMQISAASHTMSTPWATKYGKNSGSTM